MLCYLCLFLLFLSIFFWFASKVWRIWAPNLNWLLGKGRKIICKLWENPWTFWVKKHGIKGVEISQIYCWMKEEASHHQGWQTFLWFCNTSGLIFLHLGVSINGGTPKWMVSNGKYHENTITGWWFQPLWKIWKSVEMMTFHTLWKNKCSKPPSRLKWMIRGTPIIQDTSVFPGNKLFHNAITHGDHPQMHITVVHAISWVEKGQNQKVGYTEASNLGSMIQYDSIYQHAQRWKKCGILKHKHPTAKRQTSWQNALRRPWLFWKLRLWLRLKQGACSNHNHSWFPYLNSSQFKTRHMQRSNGTPTAVFVSTHGKRMRRRKWTILNGFDSCWYSFKWVILSVLYG